MVERGRRPGFGMEALEECGIVGQGVMQDLDRDAPTQCHVVSEIHRRGRSGADGRDQPITPSEHLTDTVDQAGNGHADKVVVTPVGFANAVVERPRWAVLRAPNGITTGLTHLPLEAPEWRT